MAAHLILASTSPRRQQILAAAGYRFVVHDPGPDGPGKEGDPAARVLGHAQHKALAGARAFPADLVLAADTLVWNRGEVLGKPADVATARAMLQGLQGQEHQVWTGACLARPDAPPLLAASCARVRFAVIPAEALETYLTGSEWCDKAGGYGIQGWAGRWAELVAGSLDTVIGLHLADVQKLLSSAGACPDAANG